MNVSQKLKGLDLWEVTEAVAHVIAAVPNAELAQVFRMFCAPIAQQLANLASKTAATQEEDIPLIIGKTPSHVFLFTGRCRLLLNGRS